MDNTKRYQRLLERYRNGDLDRRTFLGLIGAAGARLWPADALRPHGPGAGRDAGALRRLGRRGLGGLPPARLRPLYRGDRHHRGRRHLRRRRRVPAQVRASQEGEYNIAHLSGVFDYARYVNFGLTTSS
jgi:spermidine/putrescine transport system substrate-binding protein